VDEQGRRAIRSAGAGARSAAPAGGNMSQVVESGSPASTDAHAGHGPPPLDIQIVPRKGLPFVALAIAFVIYAIASDSRWALTFSHVAGGGMWTAIDLYVGLVLGPIIGTMSLPARAEFSAKFMPKMLLLMPTVVMMTLAAGFQLAMKLGTLYPVNETQNWLIVSMVVVGIMAVVALGVLEPANVAVLFEMKKPQPDGEVIGRLMQRFVYTAGITGVLQVATLIIMTRVASL